ncbi:Lreu_0056 family protein [Ligilactobacillus araffinosus]
MANESRAESNTQTSDTDSVESSVATASSTATANKQTANDPQVTPQQLGTMVGFLQSPDWFKEYLKDGTMYYGTNNPKTVVGGNQVNGYDFITANGDSESYIYYKKNGNMVTIKWVANPADSEMKSQTISYHNLLQDYYQNQDQKVEVNNDANQLKSWSSINQAVCQSQN